MTAPNAAVAGADHAKLETPHGLYRVWDEFPERGQDVGIVALRFIEHVLDFRLVIKALGATVMLTESIAGKEDFFFRAVGHHGIRPVDHGDGNKGQAPFPKADAFPLRHDLAVEDIAVVFLQFRGALRRNEERGIRAFLGKQRK